MSLKGPTGWAHLAPMAGGYLHQDFTNEYGDATRAVQAFLADAHPGDVVRISSEWRTFLNVTHGMTATQRAAMLRQIAGGAWAPADADEFERVSAVLVGAWRGQSPVNA